MNRRALLGTIHCAKRDLGLDDGAYRALLQRVGGQSSCAQMNDGTLARVADELRRLGWKPNGQDAKRSDKPHVRKIWAVWGSICRLGGAKKPTKAGLRAFVERLTGQSDPEWLTPEQANTVIESLKVWETRARKNAEER